MEKDWLANQLLTMDADIVGFQEIFEESALRSVLDETNRRVETLNAATLPGKSKSYHRKVIFRKLAVEPYTDAALAFAPNAPPTRVCRGSAGPAWRCCRASASAARPK